MAAPTSTIHVNHNGGRSRFSLKSPTARALFVLTTLSVALAFVVSSIAIDFSLHTTRGDGVSSFGRWSAVALLLISIVTLGILSYVWYKVDRATANGIPKAEKKVAPEHPSAGPAAVAAAPAAAPAAAVAPGPAEGSVASVYLES